MSKDKQLVEIKNIQKSIFTIRGIQVMLDKDLADLYGVKAIRLREQVKRNIKRFPDDFMFQLTNEEVEFMVSQNAIPSKQHLGGHLPLVFTEQGISMLSAVLKTEMAIDVSLRIIRAFVEMKKFISENANIFQRLDNIEQKQVISDKKFDRLFKALEDKSIKPKQGIFYDGQVFDAYVFVADLVKSAKKSILLIDNYIDESILQLFTKRKKSVTVDIYTKNFSKILKQDLEKYNSQYPEITIRKFSKAHDRFLIVDEKTIYHFGASLKDLGKKWFAFSKMEFSAIEMIGNLKADKNGK